MYPRIISISSIIFEIFHFSVKKLVSIWERVFDVLERVFSKSLANFVLLISKSDWDKSKLHWAFTKSFFAFSIFFIASFKLLVWVIFKFSNSFVANWIFFEISLRVFAWVSCKFSNSLCDISRFFSVLEIVFFDCNNWLSFMVS